MRIRATSVLVRETAPPSVALAPLQAQNLTTYDSASRSRRTRHWYAPTTTPNGGVLPALATLRDRSRHAVRNDGYADGAIDVLVRSLIGTGITPLSLAADKKFRKNVQAAFLTWTDESDADGLLDYYGQQSQATRGWLEAGEVFVRLRPRLPEDGLSVPLQVQVIEPELCPHMHEAFRLTNGNTIRAGIEINPIGRRVAYWFYKTRPGGWDDFNLAELVRVPAESVIHLYNPLRAGQLRGLPHLQQLLLRLHELDKFDDATLLRQQLSNMFVGFVKRASSASNAEIDPLTNLPVRTDAASSLPLVQLQPGIMQELGADESIEWSKPPEAGQWYEAFMRQQLQAAAASAKVPYELLSGDMKNVNDRTIRVILTEFRRRIAAWQHQIIAHQFCRRIWRAWMDQAWFAGVSWLPDDYILNPEKYVAAEHKPQRFDYIHPVQDVQAQKEAVRCGFISRSGVVSEQGDDVEDIDEQQASDNARADDLGLRYDTDGRSDGNASTGDDDSEDDDVDDESVRPEERQEA